MSSCEVFDSYINTIDVIEDSVIDDTKFSNVKDNKLKQIFRVMLEFLKVIINYLKYYINATKKVKPDMSSKMKKQPIPEDFELSDDEPTTINLDEEQKLTSKFITFDCPLCQGKLQLRNELKSTPRE